MKNILFITEHNPFGHFTGGQQRTHLIFDALQRLGHIHLFCITDEEPPALLKTDHYTIHHFGPNTDIPSKLHWSRRLFAAFNPYHLYPLNADFSRRVRELMDTIRFDIIFVRYIPPIFICGLLRTRGLVIDVDDIPHHYYWSLFKSRQSPFFQRILNLMYAVHVYLFSRIIFKNARLMFYSNPLQTKGERSTLLPNIPFKTISKKSLSHTRNLPRVFFVGSFSYLPNVNGMNHFIEQLWPVIKEEVPEASLEIAGRITDSTLRERWSSVPGVSVRGLVEDLDDSYHSARVVIVPIYEGAGTHIKILEAMHYHKACVLTGFASRGFEELLQNGKNVVIAKSDRDFIEGVVCLLKDVTLAHETGKSAYEAVAGKFSRSDFNKKIKVALNMPAG